MSYPISEQSGLTNNQLQSMKPNKQVYPEIAKLPVVAISGVVSQQSNIINNIKKSIMDYEKSKAEADLTDTSAISTCISKLATDLYANVLEIIQAQAVTVNTIVVGTAGVIPVAGTGTALPAQVSIV